MRFKISIGKKTYNDKNFNSDKKENNVWNKYAKNALIALTGAMIVAALISSDNAPCQFYNISSIVPESTIDMLQYDSKELSKLIINDNNLAESLEGKKIEISGKIKGTNIPENEIYILGNFRSKGWFICHMDDKYDVSIAKAGGRAVIKGTFKKFGGHIIMTSCRLTMYESADRVIAKKATTAPTEKT